MPSMPGYEPGPHWLEASTLTTVVSPAPQGLSPPPPPPKSSILGIDREGMVDDVIMQGI